MNKLIKQIRWLMACTKYNYEKTYNKCNIPWIFYGKDDVYLLLSITNQLLKYLESMYNLEFLVFFKYQMVTLFF